MQFQHVCLESLGYTLPEEIITSDALEAWLAPTYERLRLPAGRLELMTGIRERRFWAQGVLPSEPSSSSVRAALEAAELPPTEIGALVHASVCRDYLEPATACVVHKHAGLAPNCMLYDISNACLGFLNGMLQVAALIELGFIKAGVVVSSEGSRPLVEATVERLLRDPSITRDDMKLAFASLTIGSASVAAVLCHRDLSRTHSKFLGGICQADTSGVDLCHSGRDEAGAEMRPLMQTDSETLMHAGVALGRAAFEDFLRSQNWSRDDVAKTICHQVGLGHRKLMLGALGLPAARDFTTLEFLGNTGSAALPITLATAAERGFLERGDRLALLGIGSGINTIMCGVEWQTCRVRGTTSSGRGDSTLAGVASSREVAP